MPEEMLEQMFDDVFKTLGIPAIYQGNLFIDCRILVKEPEQLYELGDGQFVERIATFEVKAEDVANPKIGDFLYINGRKYKVHHEPLLDPSGKVYEIEALLVGLENQ